MKLYRRKRNNEPFPLEECKGSDIDFTRPVLFVFPGDDGVYRGPYHPPPAIIDSYIKMTERLLDVGPGQDKVQIIAVGWESDGPHSDKFAHDHGWMRANSDYSSSEAEAFFKQVKPTDFNSDNVTVLSYCHGTNFLKQYANLARRSDAPLDKLRSVNVGAVVPLEQVSQSCPGIYV